MSNKSWRIALCAIGAVALLIVGVAGFGAHASDNYEFVMIERVKQTKVLKSDYKVYVEFGESTITYNSKKDYDEINDSTDFYKITIYNYYGTEKINFITRDYQDVLDFDEEIDIHDLVLNKKIRI